MLPAAMSKLKTNKPTFYFLFLFEECEIEFSCNLSMSKGRDEKVCFILDLYEIIGKIFLKNDEFLSSSMYRIYKFKF